MTASFKQRLQYLASAFMPHCFSFVPMFDSACWAAAEVWDGVMQPEGLC